MHSAETKSKQHGLRSRIQERLVSLGNSLLDRLVTPARHGIDLVKKATGSQAPAAAPPKDQPVRDSSPPPPREVSQPQPIGGMEAGLPPPPLRPRPYQPFVPQVPVVDRGRCTGCGECVEICAVDAISVEAVAQIDESACIMCGACVAICPEQALDMPAPGQDRRVAAHE
jgi:ferredoxin